MKPSEILKKVETLLSLDKVKLAQAKLENGAVIEAETMSEGEAVFIVTEDERVPLPVGEYELEDGGKLLVEEEGVIAKLLSDDEDVEAEEEKEVEAEDKEKEELAEEEEEMEEEEKQEEMSYVTREELEEAKEEIKAMIDEMKEKVDSLESVEEEQMEEEKEELQTQLSEAAVKPLKHNPEGETKVSLKRLDPLRKHQTTMDRILDKISKVN
jgi:myosin heavy subunit